MGSHSHIRPPDSRRAFSFSRSAARALLAVVSALAATSMSACSPEISEGESSPGVERLEVSVQSSAAMLPDAFTQGLEVDEQGNLLIGTGQYGDSKIVRYNPVDATVLQETRLPAEFFGEGITRHGNNIWQLTWKNGQALKYDAETLAQTEQVSYNGQGWGLCAGADELIMSDGSAQLRHLDPETFAERGPRTNVTLEGSPVGDINELECVDGLVYANIWKSEEIMRIDPASGEVTAVIDASGLESSGADSRENVLNGIAHIPNSDEFWITGKRWADLYRVTFE